MARLTKQDTGITSAGSAAAPARRKSASAPRKRAIGASVTADAAEPALAEPVVEFSPAHEEIASLAYAYWVERGYTSGSPEEDWLRAEAELRQRAFAK